MHLDRPYLCAIHACPMPVPFSSFQRIAGKSLQEIEGLEVTLLESTHPEIETLKKEGRA